MLLPFLDTVGSMDIHQRLQRGGLGLLLLLTFAENGMLIGIFLPGDAILFTAGIIAGTNARHIPITGLIILLRIAAFAGDIAGYILGRAPKHMPKFLHPKKDTFLLKKGYIDVTRKFYEKHGGFALIIGRYLPFIRTLIPIIAGAIKMPFLTFLAYNIVGAAIRVTTLVTAGYILGDTYPVLINYIEIFMAIIVTLSFALLIYTISKSHQNKQ